MSIIYTYVGTTIVIIKVRSRCFFLSVIETVRIEQVEYYSILQAKQGWDEEASEDSARNAAARLEDGHAY